MKNGNLLLVASPREASDVVATLERNGFAVAAVPDVIRAGHTLERGPSPDLALLDLDVPENCISAAMAVLASRREDGAVFVDVADDGVGFASEAVPEGGGAEPAADFLVTSGAGLRLLDPPAKQLDARVERFAGPGGKGTCFRIVLPEEALAGEVADEE